MSRHERSPHSFGSYHNYYYEYYNYILIIFINSDVLLAFCIVILISLTLMLLLIHLMFFKLSFLDQFGSICLNCIDFWQRRLLFFLLNFSLSSCNMPVLHCVYHRQTDKTVVHIIKHYKTLIIVSKYDTFCHFCYFFLQARAI